MIPVRIRTIFFRSGPGVLAFLALQTPDSGSRFMTSAIRRGSSSSSISSRGAAARATSWATRVTVPGMLGRSGTATRVVERRQQDARRRFRQRAVGRLDRDLAGRVLVRDRRARAASRAAPACPSSLGVRPIRRLRLDVARPSTGRRSSAGRAWSRWTAPARGSRAAATGSKYSSRYDSMRCSAQPLAHARLDGAEVLADDEGAARAGSRARRSPAARRRACARRRRPSRPARAGSRTGGTGPSRGRCAARPRGAASRGWSR